MDKAPWGATTQGVAKSQTQQYTVVFIEFLCYQKIDHMDSKDIVILLLLFSP